MAFIMDKNRLRKSDDALIPEAAALTFSYW